MYESCDPADSERDIFLVYKANKYIMDSNENGRNAELKSDEDFNKECGEQVVEDKIISLVRSRTESDAVHPRFSSPTSLSDVEEFQQRHDYYCATCHAYFASTVLGLKEHFKPGRIMHYASSSCIYCKGPVYNYSINNKIKTYHNCREVQ